MVQHVRAHERAHRPVRAYVRRGRAVKLAQVYGHSTEPETLDYKGPWVDSDDARGLVREIGEYNQFDPEMTADAIASMPKDIEFSVGRESSPVIYMRGLPKSLGRANELLDSMSKGRPDELSFEENGNLRAWWD